MAFSESLHVCKGLFTQVIFLFYFSKYTCTEALQPPAHTNQMNLEDFNTTAFPSPELLDVNATVERHGLSFPLAVVTTVRGTPDVHSTSVVHTALELAGLVKGAKAAVSPMAGLSVSDVMCGLFQTMSVEEIVEYHAMITLEISTPKGVVFYPPHLTSISPLRRHLPYPEMVGGCGGDGLAWCRCGGIGLLMRRCGGIGDGGTRRVC